MAAHKGVFLVLEGADGVGKSSQIVLLEAFYKKAGYRVKTVHFPRLDGQPYGELIGEYLRGDFGPAGAVHPKLAALLYALDRKEYAVDIHDAIAAGAVVLADRYLFSNIAYQCARTPDPEARAALADWIEKFEYGHNALPRPDLTLYLDVPREFARANLAGKRSGDDRAYLKGKADIHEADETLQDRVRDEFVKLTRERSGEIGLVDCRGEEGRIADRAAIHSRIIDALRYYGVIGR
ncbi:MAG: dTMP kinase [Planctomycetes bacterium]|nr:dTMP kinase [Planctomycetota bacterium]